MNKKYVATPLLAVAAVGIAAGTANAETVPTTPAAVPTSISTDVLPGVKYTADVSDSSTVINTPFGSVTTRGGTFEVLDTSKHLVAGTPLTSDPNTAAWPNAAKVAGGVATAPSAPVIKAAAAIPGLPDAPGLPLHNVDAQADFNSALSVAATQFGLATGVGTLTGGVVGAGLGCVGGAATGGFVAIPTGPIAPAAAVLGCILGASVGVTLGGLAGAALIGVPVGIASAAQMYNTLHAQGEA